MVWHLQHFPLESKLRHHSVSLAEQILEIWSIDAEVAATKHFLNKKELPKRVLNTKLQRKVLCCRIQIMMVWTWTWTTIDSTSFSLSLRHYHLDTQAQFWRWVYQRCIFIFKDFNMISENQSVNVFATVPPIAVVQVQDHRPQQPQTSPAALRKDHIEKSSRSASTSVEGFWFCWTPPRKLSPASSPSVKSSTAIMESMACPPASSPSVK